MPNDAKLGLVIGVALVLLIAVVYFRKEPGVAASPGSPPTGDPPPAYLRPLVLR